MSSPKTVPNLASVTDFLNAVEDPVRRENCRELAALMRSVTRKRARMWGTSIVGFGKYHYKYDSGREGDSFLVGFSPRKQNIAIYIMPGFSRYAALMRRLGEHKTGKSCLYVKKLDDIDPDVLRELVTRSVADMRVKYACG